MAELLKQTWWSLALRGVVALVLGLLIFLWPGVTIELLLWFFGIYCLVDGAWLVIGVLIKRQADRNWWLVMLEAQLLFQQRDDEVLLSLRVPSTFHQVDIEPHRD